MEKYDKQDKTIKGDSKTRNIKKCKCFFTNARGLVRKMDELREYIKEFELDIIGVAETWPNEKIDKVEVSIDRYTAYQKDRKEVKEARGWCNTVC